MNTVRYFLITVLVCSSLNGYSTEAGVSRVAKSTVEIQAGEFQQEVIKPRIRKSLTLSTVIPLVNCDEESIESILARLLSLSTENTVKNGEEVSYDLRIEGKLVGSKKVTYLANEETVKTILIAICARAGVSWRVEGDEIIISAAN